MPGNDEATITEVIGYGGLPISVADHGPATDPDVGADGPTVILVHGYPDDRHVWDLVVPHLRERHRTVTYDVRGAGASGIPPNTAGYALAHLIADLSVVIDAVSPGREVHLVGHDWGSIQLWSAVLDPEIAARVASFTSMSGPPLEHAARWFAERRRPGVGRWSELVAQTGRSWYIGAFHTPLAPIAWRKGLAKRWPAMMRKGEGAETDHSWPSPRLADDAIAGIGLYRANMFQKLRRPDARSTEVPVQLIVSTGDPFVGPKLLEGLEAIAPDLVRVSINAKHWIPRSHPVRVAELIAEHISRVEAR